MSTDLKYPIGKFSMPASVSLDDRRTWIQHIEDLPSSLANAVRGLDDRQLDTPYRDGGWTVRQVVHHVPDSHINAYVRFRWALTEDASQIKVYEEKLWAELPDARTAPVGLSLALAEALHGRWVALLRSMSEEEWSRHFVHPESGEFPLVRAAGMYAWHGRHHVAHIRHLRDRKEW